MILYKKNPLTWLEEIAKESGVYQICRPVLEMPEFAVCSGSSNPKHHHYGDGMLLQHTTEVADLCRLNASKYFGVNMKVLITAAVYHDIGKVWDYEKSSRILFSEDGVKKASMWEGTSHKRRIHHISRSSIQFNLEARKLNLENEFIDDVTHCILSHHGQREWGSPVAPASREAWLLHLCDGISARMDDCDKIDVLEKYKR